MRRFCLPGQIRVFKDKSTSWKGYLPLAVAQEIQMKVLSFPANARIKGRKKRTVLSLKSEVWICCLGWEPSTWVSATSPRALDWEVPSAQAQRPEALFSCEMGT